MLQRKNSLEKKLAILTILIVLTITFALAETIEENKFFGSEEITEQEQLGDFLLQTTPSDEQDSFSATSDQHNEEGTLSLDIGIIDNDGNVIEQEESVLEVEGIEDDEEGSVQETVFDEDIAVDPEDNVRITPELEVNGTSETGPEFSTKDLNAELILEGELEFFYNVEHETDPPEDTTVTFNWGNEEDDSRIEGLEYEIPSPKIDLIQPEDGEVFQSGEEIEYEIDDEFRDVDDGNTFYELDGEEREFETVEDTTYIIDTSDWDEGERDVEVTAENEDGATETQENSFTIDDTDPEVEIENPEDEEVTNEEEITVEFEAEDENEIIETEKQINNEEREEISSGDTIDIEEDGEYDLTIFAEDEAGNEGEDTVSFTVDTEDPQLELIEPENIVYDTFEIPVEIEVSGEDTVEYIVNDEDDNTVKEDEIEDEETILDFEDEGRGEYQIEVSAEDEAGNTNTETEEFTVDPNPPLFETEIINTNSPIDENEILEVEAEINNTGDLSDERTVELLFEDDEEDSEEISLDSGQAENITFEYDTENEDTGDYSVEVISGEEDEETDEQEVTIGLPELELENIRIFDVTGEEEPRNNGDLLDEDLDELEIEQEGRNVEYRFEFVLENTGDSEYQVDNTETIENLNINTEWTLEDIYFENEEEIVEGGNKDEDVVEWNIGEEASIETGEQGSFEYIVETDTTESKVLEPEFKIVSEEQDIELTNSYEIDKTKYGFLETELIEPPQEFSVSEDSSFTMEANTTCLEGECGEITTTSRYNDTGENPDISISEEETEPIFTTDENPQTCEESLESRESCILDYEIQVTGETGEEINIDALSQSNLEEVDDESTEISTLTIQDSLILDVEFDQIDFGTVSPGEDEQSAQLNDLGYNITVPENSLEPEEIRVSGTKLNNERDDGYNITEDNLGYSLENNPSERNELSTEQQILTEEISPGTTLSTYYWLDIPTGITSDTYTGVIQFEAIE